MSLWKLEEVLELNKYMGNYELSIPEVKKRFSEYGGRPRYLFEQYEIHFLLNEIGTVDIDLLEDVLCNRNNLDANQGNHSKRVSSTLFVYEMPSDEVLYQYKTMGVASDYIYYKLLMKTKKQAFSRILHPDSILYNYSPVVVGKFYESVIISMLKTGCTLNEFDIETREDTGSVDIGNHSKLVSIKPCPDSHFNFFTYCSRLTQNSVIVHSKAKNNPIVDAMDSCYRGFQVTYANKHSLSIYELLKLKDTLRLSKSKPLHLYVIAWNTKLTKPLSLKLTDAQTKLLVKNKNQWKFLQEKKEEAQRTSKKFGKNPLRLP